jgi:hypothetical protein
MNTEQHLNLTAQQIVRDAPSWRIDLTNPVNAFTVWTFSSDRSRMVYCGSRPTLDAGYHLAAEHTGLRDLYVFEGPPSQYGILKFQHQ